ncbi:TetR/AcrR family transcriptional regulator [Erwinia persicina]|uniref:TetR/AcrR family transcriptional regulator n=1 Tax=Erwinia persicina TaxID=55211 RepID=UPI0017836152|nr:TetR/AcrR family transcriptional regulator [Erwinia persicina]MBD8165028.1 TetR/AcrR family transcriptional regulator [Erwinia persicina]MBD8216541.1 TetR/AcrR family transcriptional regulator [Erwinia persicina]
MNTEQDAGTRKGRGRPKTFDRDAALDKALELFWRHGYEGTSLSDLVEATGAKAPTLYAEFTNKEGMFRAAVDRYTEKFASRSEAALACPETGVAGGIEKYFRSTAACFTDGKKPGGCFFICTSSTLSADSAEVAEMLRNRHSNQEQHLLTFLQTRQAAGELDARTDVAGLAAYLCCLLQGMSVRAREGATHAELDALIDTLMLQWPVLSKLGI